MVKSVLSVNRQGLREWVIQRITAIVMAFYSIFLGYFFVTHPNLAYYEWHGLFAEFWVKIATLLFVLCLIYHAWIGMWTVFTDYIKIFWLRLLLHMVVLFALIVFLLATWLILWGI